MKYISNSRPKPLRTVINFGSFTQIKGTRRIIDLMIRLQITQISDPMNPCPARGFDRSLIWKRICSKGTPQIRNPDPDPPKRTHPKIKKLSQLHCCSLLTCSSTESVTFCRGGIVGQLTRGEMNIKYTTESRPAQAKFSEIWGSY